MCKWEEIKNSNTEYTYCKLKEKEINSASCRNCMMKIEDNNINELFNNIFGKGFGK